MEFLIHCIGISIVILVIRIKLINREKIEFNELDKDMTQSLTQDLTQKKLPVILKLIIYIVLTFKN